MNMGKSIVPALKAEVNMLRRKIENGTEEVSRENIDEILSDGEREDNLLEIEGEYQFKDLPIYSIFISKVEDDNKVYIKTNGKKINVVTIGDNLNRGRIGEKYKFSNSVEVIKVSIQSSV